MTGVPIVITGVGGDDDGSILVDGSREVRRCIDPTVLRIMHCRIKVIILLDLQ